GGGGPPSSGPLVTATGSAPAPRAVRSTSSTWAFEPTLWARVSGATPGPRLIGPTSSSNSVSLHREKSKYSPTRIMRTPGSAPLRQPTDIVRGERLRDPVLSVAPQRVGQDGLPPLQVQHLLLDRAGGDHPVDEDG